MSLSSDANESQWGEICLQIPQIKRETQQELRRTKFSTIISSITNIYANAINMNEQSETESSPQP